MENDVKEELLQKLEFLKSSLKYNWNGEGDLSIEEEAFENTKCAIQNTPEGMFKYWRLFPAPNGTILLCPKGSHIAGISIGNEEFSYAAYVSENIQISGCETYDLKAFKDALIKIHSLLGLV